VPGLGSSRAGQVRDPHGLQSPRRRVAWRWGGRVIDPVEQLGPVVPHEHMPVILEEPDWPAWLGELGWDAAELMPPAGDEVPLVTPARAADPSPSVEA
jgi:hypothetical protein